MEESYKFLQDPRTEQKVFKKSLSKEAQKWYDALLEYEKIEWECLWRNKDYKDEYEELTKTDDFKSMTDPMNDILPYGRTLHIFGQVLQFCDKWNLQYPKDPNEPFDRDKEFTRLFKEIKQNPLVTFTSGHLISEIMGARDALTLVKRIVGRSR